ncbi:MAG: copper ion binding protein, partial [Comamonas sp.]
MNALNQPRAQFDFTVEGMTCASCVGRVERALKKVPGVQEAVVNLATEKASLQIDNPAQAAAILPLAVAAIEKAGYAVPQQTVDLQVGGMTCASCVGRVERALKKVPGVQNASVNLATERATVQLGGGADLAALIAAIAKAGYEASELPQAGAGKAVEDATTQRQAAERASLQRSLIFAAVFALPVFFLEMGGHMVPAFHHWIAHTIGTQNSWYIQFVLTAIVLFGPGRRFFEKGIPALLRGAPDMNSLVAVGTSAAFAYSVVATFVPQLLPAGTVNVYYEAAAVIVALILLGRFMEARAKGNTSEAIRRLVQLQAKT